jgi:hypothetical protein
MLTFKKIDCFRKQSYQLISISKNHTALVPHTL